MEKIWEQKKVGSVLGDMSRFSVEEKKQAHALQRIIETLEEVGIFRSDDEEWGAMYWRSVLKQTIKRRKCTYEELEVVIGKDAGGECYGLLKQMRDLPAKYAKYGWIRNQLK